MGCRSCGDFVSSHTALNSHQPQRGIHPSSNFRQPVAVAARHFRGRPAFVADLRERLEDFLSDDVVGLADLLAETRVELRAMDRQCAARCPRTKTPPPLLCEDCPNRIPVERWQEAINGGVFDLVQQGKMDEARTLLKERLQRSELTPAPWWTTEEETVR